MNKDFVTYERALALKELGFDEMCLGYFDSKSELTFNTNGNPISKDWVWFGNQCLPVNMTLAPLKQQVFRWFREKYEIYGIVGYYGKSQWSIEMLNYKGNELLQIEDDFNTYEEAENACIDKLIELAKQK